MTWLCLMLGLMLAPGCKAETDTTPIVSRGWWPSPADEPAASCHDVGTVRACWEGPGDQRPPRLVPRPLPARAAATDFGWRCAGQGATRVCRDRARDAAPFVCTADRCAQRLPRLPDDGDWSCGDLGGAVVCVGGAAAAGVAPAGTSPGWLCGARAVRDELAEATARVCVDLSPDHPGGDGTGWRCHFDHTAAPVRVCVRDAAAVNLGGACGAQAACPAGARCISGRCLPPAPAPACWLDKDCGRDRRCHFASCRAESPS